MNDQRTRLYLQVLTATGSRARAMRAAWRPRSAGASPFGRKCRAAAPGGEGSADEADLARAAAALENEAVRRALSGVCVPVFHQGRECGSTVKHSDQLLMFLLKTLKPERYAGGRETANQAERGLRLELDLSAADEEDPADRQ